MARLRFPLLDRITGKVSPSVLPDLSGVYQPVPTVGTADSTTFLRGDGHWATPAGGLTVFDNGDGTLVLSGALADNGDGTITIGA